MRWFAAAALFAFVIVDGSARAGAPPPKPVAPAHEPPLAEVIAAAKQRKAPIFLDVYTDWCGPCARLEREVFPRPEVKAALAGYRVQRYDAERGAGVEVAAKYHVQSYPSLLVLFPDGTLLERV